ncbi:MAG: glycerophosphodiester phosphodiesterase, partial [Candidatus Heimdallarchaeaceae archaeon]
QRKKVSILNLPVYQTSNIPYLKNDRPLVMAHRGRSAFTPESSFQAFKEAYDLDVDALETDIRITKDLVPVVFHDKTLDRTTNGKGPISEHTYEQLQEFDLGYWYKDSTRDSYPFRDKGFKIVSLEELFEKLPKIRINMDIKDRFFAAPKALYETIVSSDVEDRVLVGSFHQKQLKRFRKISKEKQIPTSAGPFEVLAFLTHMLLLTKKRFCALQVPMGFGIIKIVTEKNIRRAHNQNIAVHSWTINDRETMRKLIEWQIDGIVTDNPDLLLDVLNTQEK